MVHASLPPEFKSLYRLFLRTVSAAVLHHPPATRNLRRLWRPIFDAGAYLTKNEKQVVKRAIVPQHSFLGKWLKQWEQRVDNTLAMLYNSSQSRGLSHQLTRNLGYLAHAERQRVRAFRLPVWNPQRPEELAKLAFQPSRKLVAKEKHEQLVAKALGPLNQVVKLAEAKDGLTLGRVAVKGWKADIMRRKGLL